MKYVALSALAAEESSAEAAKETGRNFEHRAIR